MCKCPFIFYKKTFEILCHLNRKNSFKFHVDQHVGLHHKPHQHVILAGFSKLVRFSFIFSFANMFVPKANRTNMLCWSADVGQNVGQHFDQQLETIGKKLYHHILYQKNCIITFFVVTLYEMNYLPP